MVETKSLSWVVETPPDRRLCFCGDGTASASSRSRRRTGRQHVAIPDPAKKPGNCFPPHTEIQALDGADHLENVTWRNNTTNEVETHSIRHLFTMAGAVPNTSWLKGCVALDAKGFIKTGPDLSAEDLAESKWPLQRPPHLLETSLPGVFAVGDVRAGNVKRVASAVGEGSITISFVHKVLHE